MTSVYHVTSWSIIVLPGRSSPCLSLSNHLFKSVIVRVCNRYKAVRVNIEIQCLNARTVNMTPDIIYHITSGVVQSIEGP